MYSNSWFLIEEQNKPKQYVHSLKSKCNNKRLQKYYYNKSF